MHVMKWSGVCKVCACVCSAGVALALVLPVSALGVTGDHIAPDGHYTGTGRCTEGYNVDVSFDVKDGVICNSDLSAPDAGTNEGYFQSAKASIKIDGIVASPNAIDDIDTVSFATNTSRAIKSALRTPVSNAESGIKVTMAQPVRDKLSGKYDLSLEAYATTAGASEVKGNGVVLRCSMGSSFTLEGASLSASVWEYADGSWSATGTTLPVVKEGSGTCYVSGFDYLSHCLPADGSVPQENACKVVLSIIGADPIYSNSDKTNVDINGNACGLYQSASSTSRVEGPSTTFKADIPALVPVPKGLELAYSGAELSGVVYDSAKCTAGGTLTAVELGDYFASVKLRENKGYRWADGTWDAKFVPWSIVAEPSADETAEGNTPSGEASETDGGKTEARTAAEKAAAEKAAIAAATPGKVTLTKKTKSTKKGKVTVAWKKVAKAKGYQVKVGKKTYTVKSAKAVKKTFKAAKGKKVSVQVRAFNTYKGKTLYGAWSKAKKVKVKK